MKERPILFSSPMVRAILDGRKTQTRRALKHRQVLEWLSDTTITPAGAPDWCQYQPGDRLWVRETHNVWGGAEKRVSYRASEHPDFCPFGRWTPSIHMPRWASRITLEVTGVRVERLHQITLGDLWAESFRDPGGLQDFKSYWKDWDANPWVWVIEFRRLP